MQTLRNTSLKNGRAFEAKKLAVVHAMMGKMRAYWQHWKHKTEQRAVVEEINDEGPRRLEFLRDRQDVASMQRLLQEGEGMGDEAVRLVE